MPYRTLSRRRFLLAAGSMLAGLGGTAADAFVWAPRRVQLSRYELPIRGLPAALDGLRLAHLTDIHLYDGIHPAARRAMELVVEAEPDITLFTGDHCERPSQLAEFGAMLSVCRGRLATVAVVGNWEHQVGITFRDMDRVCHAAGAEFLLNRTHVVRVRDAALALVGLDDPRAGVPDAVRAMRGLPEGTPAVWAFHAPGYADVVASQHYPVPALMLSGHTHGGQIRPPFLPPITPPASGRFVAGWYRDTVAPLYVSRGIGTSGIRARFRCPPEVPLFTLRRA